MKTTMTERERAMSAAKAFVKLMEQAIQLGGHAADAYWDEFEEQPTRETVGDWDTAAWEVAKKELADAGMVDASYEGCLFAWRLGFFGSL